MPQAKFVKKSKGGRSIVVKIDGVDVPISAKSGKPMGRWPESGKRLKAYQKAFELAEKKAEEHKEIQFLNTHQEALEEAQSEKEIPLTNEEIIELVEERFDTMSEIVDATCQGAFHSVIVSGAPGVGKTFSVEKIVKKYAEEGEVTAEFVSGIISPVHLYRLLHTNMAPNALIVLDDADNIFANEDSLNLMKAALDTKKERRINWRTNSPMLKEEGIPNTFVFEGGMIFITNMDFQGIVDAEKKISPHMEALMSRAHYIDLMIHDRDHVALWVEHMIRKENILVTEKELEKQQQEDVIQFIKANKDNMRELSIRSALKIADYVKTVPDKWEKRAAITQLRNAKGLKV